MGKKKEIWYQQTEALLYRYKSFPIRIMALKQQKEMLQEQMMPRTTCVYEPREGSYYTLSSPVENAVINRLEGDVIQEIDRKIKALESFREIIEMSMNTMLSEEQKCLIKTIYFQRNTWQQTCCILSIDKNTYYEKKNELVRLLSWCFGYLSEAEAQNVLGLIIDQDSREKIHPGNKTRINQEKPRNHKAVL